jgi:hypothetical protein
MDLELCPTFTKLKTLILNEWCVYAEVTKLVCLLRHTPRLESLILQLPFKVLSSCFIIDYFGSLCLPCKLIYIVPEEKNQIPRYSYAYVS